MSTEHSHRFYRLIGQYLSYGMQGDHEGIGRDVRGLESEGAVKRCGVLVDCIDGDRAYGELVGGSQNALERIEQKAAAQAGALVGGGDREAGEE